jgi:hypothetical protein
MNTTRRRSASGYSLIADGGGTRSVNKGVSTQSDGTRKTNSVFCIDRILTTENTEEMMSVSVPFRIFRGSQN